MLSLALSQNQVRYFLFSIFPFDFNFYSLWLLYICLKAKSFYFCWYSYINGLTPLGLSAHNVVWLHKSIRAYPRLASVWVGVVKGEWGEGTASGRYVEGSEFAVVTVAGAVFVPVPVECCNNISVAKQLICQMSALYHYIVRCGSNILGIPRRIHCPLLGLLPENALRTQAFWGLPLWNFETMRNQSTDAIPTGTRKERIEETSRGSSALSASCARDRKRRRESEKRSWECC